MRALKAAAILILLCLVALFAFGCVETFTYTTYVDKSGSMHCEFLVTYDASAGDAEEVKEQTVRTMRRYVLERGLTDYAAIDAGVDGEVCLALTFPSQTEYEIVFGYTGREENEVAVPAKKGFFVNRYDYETANYLTDANIQYFRTLLSEEYADVPLTCDFYYTYGTTSKTTTSNGEVKEKNGIYYHTWKFEYGQPSDAVISVYGLNGVVLILGIISVFVLSLAIIFVIIFINKKKSKGLRPSDEETDNMETPAE